MPNQATAPAFKKAPVVRLPPKSNLEVALVKGSQIALIVGGAIACIAALSAAQFILVPISAAIVIGLMLGPAAARLESRGIRPGLSSMIVVLVFILGLCLFVAALAAPLSFWAERMPQIWANLRFQLSQLREPLESLRGMRDQLREITGGKGIEVSVDDGVGVSSVAAGAPAVLGQILIFFASLYFFIATRRQTLTATLRLCFSRRLRWRVAHTFRDIERLVSRYLLSITFINVVEGIAVGLGLWLLGTPSAAMWGALSALCAFVPFVGPVLMTIVLFAIGLAEYDSLAGSLLPVGVYLVINLFESQFFTPLVIGRTLTLNPFVVLLALVFWIWLWGPIGGFIAIPALLIMLAITRNIIPGAGWWDADFG